jgi:hypothetical protein
MTQKIMVIDLETFRSGNQVAIQQKQVLLEALADKSKVISNIEIKGNNLLITYSDGVGDTCMSQLNSSSSVCNPTTGTSNKGFALSYKGQKGSTAKGLGSFSAGIGNTCNGSSSCAFGINNKGHGNWCISTGASNTIHPKADNSSVFGAYNNMYSSNSFVTGSTNSVKGYNSAVMGEGCSTIGKYSVAMGKGCTTKGSYSVAMGKGCKANGVSSVAMGSHNIVNNKGEFACGFYNTKAFNGYKGTTSSDGIEQYFSVGHGKQGATNNLFSIGTNSDNTYMQLYVKGSHHVFEPSLSSNTLVWTKMKGST